MDKSQLFHNEQLAHIKTQRNRLIHSFQASCSEGMDNLSSCELLRHKLTVYSNTVYKDGSNIYNSILHKSFPNIGDRRFKVPKDLPPTDLDSYLDELECPNSTKTYCDLSEKPSKAELQQFCNLFNIKVEPTQNTWPGKIDIESRYEKLEKLENQFCKRDCVDAKKQKKSFKRELETNSFKTAREELDIQNSKIGTCYNSEENMTGAPKKMLGLRRTVRSKFVSPLISKNSSIEETEVKVEEEPVVDERLKHIEPKMVELIKSEIMDHSPNISWDDIAGLEFAKSAIQEAVVWPLLRPDIFTGLRRPPKGILLFGPPGTGKTLIGKCVASQSKSTFFSISASSLTSKWIGDGEKMVRALFAVARVHQPAVIFIDEVDSLLTQRSDTEHESSRRIKTEFLVQLDGAATDSEERLLVIGATNRPQELDEAARRRFVKRLYIPLPEYEARHDLIRKLLANERHILNSDNFKKIAELSDGYSGADIKNLCSEASLGPIRSIDMSKIQNINASEVRPLAMEDFEKSFKTVRPSVSKNDLIHYVNWNATYGSGLSL